MTTLCFEQGFELFFQAETLPLAYHALVVPMLDTGILSFITPLLTAQLSYACPLTLVANVKNEWWGDILLYKYERCKIFLHIMKVR